MAVARLDVARVSLETVNGLLAHHRRNASAAVAWSHDQLDLFQDLATDYAPVGGDALPPEKDDGEGA